MTQHVEAARLAELLKRDPQKIGLAYSIMLSLPGTPIIYYGDEFGKLNDHDYYKEMIIFSGKDDTRFLVRGKIDWTSVDQDLQNKNSFAFQVYSRVMKLLNARKRHKSFGRGRIEWLTLADEQGNNRTGVLAYFRVIEGERLLILQNLKNEEVNVVLGMEIQRSQDLLGQEISANQNAGGIQLKPYQYLWINIDS